MRSNGSEESVALERWEPPTEGFYKMNDDVAYFSNSKEASLRMVVRDHMEIIHHCAMKRIGNVDSLLQANFTTILFGMEESRHSNLTSLCIESDSLMAIKEIELGQESLYEWRGIISDIHNMYKDLNFHNFRHVRRTANGCAHNMAKLSNVLGDYKL
ncbi:hypothetical protein CRYUN_Cryun03dG0096900 [Craigia yunnanensis]